MWIKICGVTRPEDVSIVVHSGADAIGFNFFPGSKRFVSVADSTRSRQCCTCRCRHTPDLSIWWECL